jgi:hypothetical protein
LGSTYARKSMKRRFMRRHSRSRRYFGSFKRDGRFLPVGMMNVSIMAVSPLVLCYSFQYQTIPGNKPRSLGILSGSFNFFISAFI